MPASSSNNALNGIETIIIKAFAFKEKRKADNPVFERLELKIAVSEVWIGSSLRQLEMKDENGDYTFKRRTAE